MAETRGDGFLVEEIPAFAGMTRGEGAAEVELGPPDCLDFSPAKTQRCNIFVFGHRSIVTSTDEMQARAGSGSGLRWTMW